MKRDVYFKNIFGIGNLYIEEILSQSEKNPICFVCSDDKKRLYVCVCTEMGKWLITRCTKKTLLKLISNEIDLNTALKSSGWIIAITRNQGEDKSRVYFSDKIDPLSFPKNGSIIKCENNRVIQNIKKLCEVNYAAS